MNVVLLGNWVSVIRFTSVSAIDPILIEIPTAVRGVRVLARLLRDD